MKCHPKFPKFEGCVGTSFNMDYLRLVVLHISFMNQHKTWLCAEIMHSVDLGIFIMSC
jgi:predicted aldo/keto reductase-like oxidoreductase